jgi:hypothetical protein
VSALDCTGHWAHWTPDTGSRGRPPKQKVGDPRGGWVGQRPKKDRGQIYFLICFYGVFLLPPLTEKKSRKTCFGFFVGFLVKAFRHDFFQNVFCSAFELPPPKKRDKTKKIEENLTSKFLSISLEKLFDMDICGVFEL